MKRVLTSLLPAILCSCWVIPALAGVERTQSVHLHAGWNAVVLEVQPNNAKPDQVFAGLPVEIVSCFTPGHSQAQYLRSPGDAPWREEGWAVWYAKDRPESFLSDLHEIQALRPLLIRATTDCTWTITGSAKAMVLEWHANTCTFTGLPVDPSAPPTFAQFFEGSPEHQRLRIYRLVDGSWKRVADPTREKVTSGQAYWIQTDGASTYQGPLRVRLPNTGVLDFGENLGGRTLEFKNEAGSAPARILIETLRTAGNLELQRVEETTVASSASRVALRQAPSLPALASGRSVRLRLEPDRNTMTGAESTSLLRITDGRGSQLWVPVIARRGNASAQTRP